MSTIIAARINHKRLAEPDYLARVKALGVTAATVCIPDLTTDGLEQVYQIFPNIMGHALITKRDPLRFNTKADLQDYVEGVISKFPQISEWEVTSEIFHHDRLDAVMPDPDWPMYVYEAAREAAPTAKLWMNEYAIKNKTLWGAVIQLAKRLKNQGLLDGVGVQRHVDLRGKLKMLGRARFFDYGLSHLASGLPMRRLNAECDRISDLGLEVHLSEVSVRAFPSQMQTQSALYSRLLYAANQKTNRITYWWPVQPLNPTIKGNPGLYEVTQNASAST